jgi:3-oxoacyl-[acyl-carrier-protein] synthase-3
MANIQYTGAGISAVSACVPRYTAYNKDLGYLIPKSEDIQRLIQSTGIEERHIADENTCASDLCLAAAEQLLADGKTDRTGIDALIFVTQTPDYRQPATAMNIQHRLGLPKSTLSFDINLACSGYVYGLSVAFAFTQAAGINKVLLLAGDTLSKVVSRKDKATLPLFGDAGTATLVEKGNYPHTCFTLNSDGGEAGIINIPCGGYRQPSSPESLEEIAAPDGNIRNGEQLYMDGAEVFNFGLREVPKDIRNLLLFTGESPDTVDLIIYHQANRFMTDFFTRKLKFSTEKTPCSIDRFGNTASASIPLTIVSEMHDPDRYTKRKKVIISGFGAGLSWGSALIDLSNTKISRLTTL